MSESLLATKLYLPQLPPRVLQRQFLLDLLESGRSAEKRLILVCAPAGYGKTTLVCEWLQNASNVCWFSLEKSDNDPRLFFSYLVAGLQKTSPGVGTDAGKLLDSPQLPPLQIILTSLLNDLAAIDDPLMIVLDDYQSISTSAIHEGITFLLDHLPPNKHIVITTRSDPALPLHRYRSRGQVVEIRADDLRFSQKEISIYMEEMAGLHFKGSEIATLEKRTEGWIAGLQMAALSLRGKTDSDRFIQSLAGTNRHILEYLLEEILNNQPPDIQGFLMETSILDRVCPPLCDVLLDAGQGTGRRLLQSLERENLFIVPLDDERYWYRYHHLFRDLLEMRLKHSAPQKLTTLHQRAAGWFVTTGEIDQAVHHYIQGQDFERAAELVEQHAIELFALGKLDQLLGWTNKLPVHLSAERPWLCIYQAWTLAFAGKNAQAEELIQVAIQAVERIQPSLEARKSIWTEIYGIRALVAITSGNLQEAFSLHQLLDTEASPDRYFARSVIVWAAGYAWRMQGQLAKATEAFREVLAIGKKLNNVWTMSTGFVDLGMVLRLSGRLREAASLYREGLEIMRSAGTSGLGFIGRLESFLASALYEQNMLDEAAQLIMSSTAHAELWNNPNHVAHAYMVEARILMGRGDSRAEETLRKAAEAAKHPAVVQTLRAGIDSVCVQYWLEHGQLAAARDWVDTHPRGEESGRNAEIHDVETLIHARIFIAQGNNSAAWKLLDEIEKEARATGRMETLIKVLTLQALAASSHAAARRLLEAALVLGVPEGYRRLFLDEGEKFVSLLEGLRGRSEFVERLLPGAAGEKIKKVDSLLTARELDILRGMAAGLSNKEIGKELFISAGTVKAHSAAIYRKLEVMNRTEAIARAKDLGLI